MFTQRFINKNYQGLHGKFCKCPEKSGKLDKIFKNKMKSYEKSENLRNSPEIINFIFKFNFKSLITILILDLIIFQNTINDSVMNEIDNLILKKFLIKF